MQNHATRKVLLFVNITAKPNGGIMSNNQERYIGLSGSGNETEFDIVKETEKAYLLKDEYDHQFWMPKSAFDDDGSMKPNFYGMLESKLADE
jgi:hypothetical protein